MFIQRIAIVKFNMIVMTNLIDILSNFVCYVVNNFEIFDVAKEMMQHQFCFAIIVEIFIVLVFRKNIDNDLVASKFEIFDSNISFVISNKLIQNHVIFTLSNTIFLQFDIRKFKRFSLFQLTTIKRNDASLFMKRTKIQRFYNFKRLSKIQIEKNMTNFFCRSISFNDDFIQNFRNVIDQKIFDVEFDCVQQDSIDFDELLKLLFLFDDVFDEISDNKDNVIAKEDVDVDVSTNDENEHVFVEQEVVSNRLKHEMFDVKLVFKRKLCEMFLRKVKSANQIVDVIIFSSSQTILKSAFDVTLISIQRFRQLTHCV